MITRFRFGAPRRKPGIASSVTLSLAFHDTSLYGPEAAELVFSQALPWSPSFSLARAVFLSTTEATMEVIRFSTSVGAKPAGTFKVSVEASGALIRSFTLPLSQPSWVKRKPEVLFMITTRCSDQAQSSAVTGLPEWNFRPARILKV